MEFVAFDNRYNLKLDEPIAELSTEGKLHFHEVLVNADTYSVTLYRHSGSLFAYTLHLIPLVFYFIFTLLLHKLVISAQKGFFFQKQNVARLRAMGYLLVVWEIISFAYKKYSDFIFDRYLESDVLARTGFQIGLQGLLENAAFAGVLVLILAQAFNYGLRLKEEQELTI